jgi:hypothetical protein
VSEMVYGLSATAQAPGNPVVAVVGDIVYTANGDAYTVNGNSALYVWTYRGNVFGSATSAQSISIGGLKAKYAK